MKKQIQHQKIIKKQEILLNTKKQLKKEFIGIDNVIDQVLDLCSTWYLLPELQERPIVINLWGLTGVGKSSLINRLAELLDFNEKYYRFNLNLNEGNNFLSIKNYLAEIYEYDNGYPIMISFDEFQHIRTIDEYGNEIGKSNHKIIWDLLDSGKFTLSRDHFYIQEISELVYKLEYILSYNVKVSKGLVTHRKAFFKNAMADKDYGFHDEINTPGKNMFFVPEEYHMRIYNLTKEKFKSPFHIKQHLMKLNGSQTITFLNEVLSYSKSPKTYDCSKSIIFILGNLDEAYTMSNSYNPDMEADEFHKQSLKINITNIKDVLQKRFRNEQIARLGNNHIIYPAFNRKTFEKIILKELKKIILNVKTEYQIDLILEDSIHDIIYKEGVYPTQGTRPVFSTIYQLIGSKVGKLISQLYIHDIEVDSISVFTKNNEIYFNYLKNGFLIHSFSEKPTLNLSKLRENKKDDIQAIVAVHETGHALLSIFLLNTIPDVIYSNTADFHSGGFVYSRFKWNYISKKEIISRIAFYLGGIIAEKIIFGEENITAGSESDIKNATNFVTGMLKDSGMGDLPASFQVKDVETKHNLFERKNEINNQVRELIKQAEQLAEQTLKQQEYLLIKMADFLSDNRVLHKEEIKDYLIKYAKDFNMENIIEKGDHLFYRKHLKQEADRLKSNENSLPLTSGFSVNKKLSR